MFNFLFDGTISSMGERLVNYAAPVHSVTQQYQLAIQHHRNDEARHFIQSRQVAIGDITECGLADIHVACRFNNFLMLELLISQGLDINLPDKNRNTPLHYASRYGNIDICRYLVGIKCRTSSRNATGQSPYDVAESHIVRQYLLPLQFQEEANHPEAIAQQQQPQDPFAIGGRTQLPTNVAPPPVFSPSPGGGGLSANSPQINNFGQSSGGTVHSRYVAYPGIEDKSNVPEPDGTALSTNFNNHNVTPTATPNELHVHQTPSRIIRPDGFGSSHTDVKLQQKYGNVKEQVHVAPPPVANIVSTPSQKVNQVQSNPAHQGTCNQLPIPSKLAVFPPRVPGISTSLNNSPKSLDENISKTETKDESTVSQSQSPSHHTRSSTAQILNSHHDSMPPTNPTTDASLSQVGATRPSTHPDDSCASKPVTSSNKTFSSSTSTLIRPDGFGSSQTDVKLQQKYGNVKEQIYIGPPPVANMSSTVTPYTGVSSNLSQSQQQVFQGHPPAMYQKHSQQQQYPHANTTPPLPYAYSSSTKPKQMNDSSSTFTTIDLNATNNSGNVSEEHVVQATSTSSAMM